MAAYHIDTEHIDSVTAATTNAEHTGAGDRGTDTQRSGDKRTARHRESDRGPHQGTIHA
jgi:hypothetical protein